MLIYNAKCPTVNHSYQYHIYKQLHDDDISSYDNVFFNDYNHTLSNLEERKFNNFIYYTLNSDESFELINSYSPDDMHNIIEEQKSFISNQLKTLLEYSHISNYSATITTKQYEELIFINWLAFELSYINDILSHKQNEITNDIITSYELPPTTQTTNQSKTKQSKSKKQTIEINTKELRRISWYSPYVKIEDKEYYIEWQDNYIDDKHRYVYILGSRQTWKSYATAYIAYENSFIPNQKILVSSFSAISTYNMRDYILEFAEKTPPLPNWQPAFTFFSKEAFLINNITKSKIFFRTLADEWKWIRWMKLNLVLIDEAAFVANEIYERVLFPTTTTTKWRIIALSTPEKKNWFYEAVMSARKDNQANTILYEIDYTKNPFIYSDLELLNRIESNKHKASIRQEYMCEFVWDEDTPFQINLSDFFPQTSSRDFYVLWYDPARKWKDRAWYTLLHLNKWIATSILSWEIPEKTKETWGKQALFLKDIQNKYNAKLVMDVTWVWDWVITILKQYWLRIDMAVNYTNSSTESLDKNHPYWATKCYKVWKSVLINKTIDYFDERVLFLYEYSNRELIKEIWQLSKTTAKLWQIWFETSYYDDITNSLMLAIYYIYNTNLLFKKQKLESNEINDFDTYDYNQTANQQYRKNFINNKTSSSRIF